MKKIAPLALVLILALAGCSNNNSNFANVTFYLVADPQTEIGDLPPETSEVEGCGTEFLVPHTVAYQDSEDTLDNALNALFTNNETIYPDTNLLDTTYMSDLLATSDLQDSGVTTVNLEGVLMYAGHCDTPRYKAQVEKTVELYLSESEYEIQVNGDAKEWRCLGDESGLCQ